MAKKRKQEEKIPNLENHAWVMEQLEKAQEDDSDNREAAKEAKLFLYKRDGQWEQSVYDRQEGKPRYTFDMVNPVVDQVAGDMEESDFDIRITPAGGGADDETAKTYDGLTRHIDKISVARSIYDRAGRGMIVSGIDGWRISQEYTSGDSFDQDLMIKRIPNYSERVWHGPHEEPDASDAKYAWVLTEISKEEFEERYPDKSPSDVEKSDASQAFGHGTDGDGVMICEFLYLKEEERELVKMSDGRVLEVDDAFEATKDELAEARITEVARRKRIQKTVYSRLASAHDWLTEPRETVFENWIPIIPCYANFEVIEGKVVYWGVVEKLMDPQRVFNYSLSREIEEGALAPRAVTWMTPAMAEGHDYSDMNTSADPVRFYNPDPEAPNLTPQQNGGAQINPGLRNISEAMRQIVSVSAGMFAANMGDNPGLQSGKAIENLQDRGDTGANKYTESREISQRHTARILVNAIPRVYEPGRQVRLLREDGSHQVVTIGQRVFDEDSQRAYTLHDLSAGTYDVECVSGPSYKSRQNETVEGIIKIGQIDPTAVEMGSDILMNNMTAPGMSDLAARKREQLFKANMIPVDQMTEEEHQLYQQMQQQPPEESPDMVLARAEEAKAQADHTREQIRLQEMQLKAQESQGKAQVDQFNAETQRIEALTKRMEATISAQEKGATAALRMAEAEAQDIENDAVVSGIDKLARGASGG